MDLNGNNIKYPGGNAAEESPAFSHNVTISDPRIGPRGRLPDHRNRGPLNSSSSVSPINNYYQQPYTSHSSNLNASVAGPWNTSSKVSSSMPKYGNINPNSDTDLRNIQQHPQQVPNTTTSTLASSPISHYNSQRSLYDGNLYQSSQMRQIGIPLQPPTISKPEHSRYNQMYHYQYGQPRPIGTIFYDAYGQCTDIRPSLKQALVDPGETVSSTSTNMSYDLLNVKPDIIPKADNPMTNPNNKVETIYESLNKTSKPTAPVIMIGKRRGGKILPTGVIKRPKASGSGPNEAGKKETVGVPSKLDVKSPAWNRYLAEVQQYRSQLCSDEKQNHPLVK